MKSCSLKYKHQAINQHNNEISNQYLVESSQKRSTMRVLSSRVSQKNNENKRQQQQIKKVQSTKIRQLTEPNQIMNQMNICSQHSCLINCQNSFKFQQIQNCSKNILNKQSSRVVYFKGKLGNKYLQNHELGMKNNSKNNQQHQQKQKQQFKLKNQKNFLYVSDFRFTPPSEVKSNLTTPYFAKSYQNNRCPSVIQQKNKNMTKFIYRSPELFHSANFYKPYDALIQNSNLASQKKSTIYSFAQQEQNLLQKYPKKTTDNSIDSLSIVNCSGVMYQQQNIFQTSQQQHEERLRESNTNPIKGKISVLKAKRSNNINKLRQMYRNYDTQRSVYGENSDRSPQQEIFFQDKSKQNIHQNDNQENKKSQTNLEKCQTFQNNSVQFMKQDISRQSSMKLDLNSLFLNNDEIFNNEQSNLYPNQEGQSRINSGRTIADILVHMDSEREKQQKKQVKMMNKVLVRPVSSHYLIAEQTKQINPEDEMMSFSKSNMSKNKNNQKSVHY